MDRFGVTLMGDAVINNEVAGQVCLLEREATSGERAIGVRVKYEACITRISSKQDSNASRDLPDPRAFICKISIDRAMMKRKPL